MTLAFREHERVARLIAKELEDEGYAVFLEPTPEQMPFSLEEYLLKAEKVTSLGTSELAVPFLWNAIVALLRRKARTAARGFSELTDRSLINQLYSLGEVSAEQYDMLRTWQELRNLAVHNLDFVADSKDVDAMLAFAKMLISEIRH